MRWIDYGLGGLEASALELVASEESDLAALYRKLVEIGLLFGYEVSERFYEIGSPESLVEADEFLRNRRIGYLGESTQKPEDDSAGAAPAQSRSSDD